MTMPDNIIGSGNGGHPKYEFEHLFINAQPKIGLMMDFLQLLHSHY